MQRDPCKLILCPIDHIGVTKPHRAGRLFSRCEVPRNSWNHVLWLAICASTVVVGFCHYGRSKLSKIAMQIYHQILSAIDILHYTLKRLSGLDPTYLFVLGLRDRSLGRRRERTVSSSLTSLLGDIVRRYRSLSSSRSR